MFYLSSSKKCTYAILVVTFLAKRLAEVVSHILTLFSGTKYLGQSSAHPPV